MIFVKEDAISCLKKKKCQKKDSIMIFVKEDAISCLKRKKNAIVDISVH